MINMPHRSSVEWATWSCRVAWVISSRVWNRELVVMCLFADFLRKPHHWLRVLDIG
jgi:hypothetical protein